jgi:pantetheine-phosphate adenylyltransferase
MKKIAVYPGSFDPITNGHISVIRRGLKVVDQIIVLIAHNSSKNSCFNMQERVEFIKELNINNVIVDSFQGLLIDACNKYDASIIIRGLRAISDFDYEFQMSLGNRRLNRDIETIFFMTSYKYSYLSSSLIKEIALNGGDIKGLVPENVINALTKKRTEG